ncbi:hypothetical protein SAMN05421636_101322 [Pricia antarctica]|uniref:Uncharacterized protein n=1 Tax=Pricia antarctica TaxID=641691 RepID=A0A1G6WI07_9FLAO|nr:hypothetical protein [Pricia antarctica]SDD65451.1 hypothetical protein SAMN05421636_101322 [Pricia antarctica]
MGVKYDIYLTGLKKATEVTNSAEKIPVGPAQRVRELRTCGSQWAIRNPAGIVGIIFIVFSIASCDLVKKSKSDIEIEFMLDTLEVGYTYWWPESGPFIGNCGQELSLVFSGTIKELEAPNNEAGPLYTPQNGIIAIEEVFKIKELGENTYKNQRFFATDCFYKSGLGTGDKVLVVCYDYEDAYTIPGSGSILKIDTFDDEAVASIRKYIDTDENPLKIKKDVGLWATYGHGRALEDLIACRKEMENPDKSISVEVE